MAYGIGQEIEELTELGVPALTQMQSVNPQLKYALALQEATNIVNAAARERDMAMEQPQPPQVVGQLEQGLAERLMPGAQQMAQQMPPQPMPMQPGVAGLPAPNMMMAGGGIVSFADGGMPVGNNQPIPKLMQKYGSDVVMRFLEGQQRFRNIEGNVSPQAREQFEMEKANFMSGFPVEFIQDVLQTQSGSLDISEEMASGGIVGFAGPDGSYVSKALMDSLIDAESGGNPNAVSRVGAQGLTQVMPKTGRQPGFGVTPLEDPFDPEQNRAFGEEYLSAMISRYDGDVETALVAYNAGYGNADNFLEAGKNYDVLPRPGETRPYVDKVLRNAETNSVKDLAMSAADSAKDLIARRTLNQEAETNNVRDRAMSAADSARDLIARRTLNQEAERGDTSFSMDGITNALENIVGATSSGERVSPGEEAAIRRRALREEGVPLGAPDRELRMLLPELAESYDAEQQAAAEAEMNLLDAAQGRRDAFFDLINKGMESSEAEPVNYADEIGSAYRDLTGGAGLNTLAQQMVATPTMAPVGVDADAEAEINLLNAAQGRRDSFLELLGNAMGPAESEEVSSYVPPNKGDYGMVYGPGDMLRDANVPNEYNPFSVLSPGNISDTVRSMRQKGAETVERRSALAEANPSLSTEDIAALDEQLQSNVTSERNQTAPNLYQYGTEDIVEEGQVSPNLYQYGTEEIVEEDQNGNNVVDEIIEQQMESEAIGGPGSDAKYRTSEEIIAAEEGKDGVNTGSGRYEVIGTDDNNLTAQRPMSIQEQYSQLTQPQSGTEAFFDLLQTLGGGAGRSKGYEAAGIMQQAQDRDQLEQIEALALIEAQNRADAIDAQNQTDQSRFIDRYIAANRGGEKTPAQLGVEATQVYLRANNIYAGQTNRMADYSDQVSAILLSPTNQLTLAYNRAVRGEGPQSQEAQAAFAAILDQAQQVFEAGQEVINE